MFFREHRERMLRKELLLEAVVFALTIALLVYFDDKVFLLTIILILFSVLSNRLWHQKHDIFFYITGAILGPLAEIVCTANGVWRYEHPTFLNIPLWLPFAWGIAAVMITRIAETFVKIEKR
ncbi:MAG: hypothetical protein V1685_05260 [Parcubacteria group bacterium]